MQNLTLPSGALMPKYGMGTWHMGERGGAHAQETAALVAGLDAGVRLIEGSPGRGFHRFQSAAVKRLAFWRAQGLRALA
jgi:diketogulonate reductase-like aldo/keto reductase